MDDRRARETSTRRTAATPTEAVVDPMVAHLAVALRRHNRRAAGAARMQLRAALHVGPVRRGPKGVSGISIITARRTVDAPAVQRRVADTGAATRASGCG
ncbi:hypothetical protein ETD83_01985 [Actinomadura soli]|uniref:Uncharacterized protein n=1 Tax=Actinomadura soli TaxID=2508997 RepID=A0A5C4JKI0_9ACTN|nr:hypothetical protein [Actinomadura soli]TMR07057.1 hypothetical protein ETD83_01985 [Actinomadura soli]